MAMGSVVLSPENPWVRILALLEKKVTRHSYDTWLKPTRFSHSDGPRIFVRVPTPDFQQLGEKFGDLIQEAIEQLGLQLEEVEFLPAEPPGSRSRPDGRFPPAPAVSYGAMVQGRFDWDGAAQLVPRYTFDGFVTGNGNQFAAAAARAVAERQAYNPLFLYGGVGLGKTHLMHAIGHETKRLHPHKALRYITSENFTNEVINSLRCGKMSSFRDKFRSLDMLLIDDVQFFSRKERTQEEFFHTFNALHETQKQIVVASDRAPRELADIEDRLRSRFEWGLIADIQPPDLETKVAILQKKAEHEHLLLPDDVALFIASNIRSNVRELEGALVRLIAKASLDDVNSVTIPYAQEVLKNIIEAPARKVTIETIQKLVAEQFGLRLVDLKARNNSKQIVFPRQIAMCLAKELTGCSLPEIGRQFGGKHHTTVLHSISKIEAQRKNDKDLERLLVQLIGDLQK
jgi:chromosomal replication initiator protein